MYYKRQRERERERQWGSIYYIYTWMQIFLGILKSEGGDKLDFMDSLDSTAAGQMITTVLDQVFTSVLTKSTCLVDRTTLKEWRIN
jgi:hypothetical protein